jgi:hypothetical protein
MSSTKLTSLDAVAVKWCLWCDGIGRGKSRSELILRANTIAEIINSRQED